MNKEDRKSLLVWAISDIEKYPDVKKEEIENMTTEELYEAWEDCMMQADQTQFGFCF